MTEPLQVPERTLEQRAQESDSRPEMDDFKRRGYRIFRCDLSLHDKEKKAIILFTGRCSTVYKDVSPRILDGRSVITAKYERNGVNPQDKQYLSRFLL